MWFWPFHGGDQQVFHQVPQFSLDDLEYAFEFSENEQVLLQRAFDNQEKGGVFHVLKQTGPSGQGGRSQLSKFNEVHRPDRIFPHPRRHHPTVQALSISHLDSTFTECYKGSGSIVTYPVLKP